MGVWVLRASELLRTILAASLLKRCWSLAKTTLGIPHLWRMAGAFYLHNCKNVTCPLTIDFG